jgi:putative MATE family efflux protein
VGTIANMILDPIFIFTLGYGVNGAAIATGISETIVLASLSLLLFAQKKTHIRIVFSGFKLSRSILYDIVKTGLPASLSMALVSIMHASMNGIIVGYSPLAVGAFQMGSRIDMFLFLPHIAISSSLMTLAGVFTGAQRWDLIKSTAHYGMLASLLLSVIGGAILYVAALPIASAFTTDTEIRSLVVPYFKILALTYPFVGLNVCAARTLQGMGLGKPILITSFVRTIIVAIPLAYYFAKVLNMPNAWVWIAFAIARVLAMVISQVWFAVVMNRGRYASAIIHSRVET